MKKNISSGHFSLGPDIEVNFCVENKVIQHIELNASPSSGLKWKITDSEKNPEIEAAIVQWLVSYINKKPLSFPLPFNWNKLPPFTVQVLHKLQEIPFAHTFSYGQLAYSIEKPRAARAIGQACGRNPFLLLIPCHRVLAANNSLGGFSAGIEIKKRLLKFENVSYKAL